MPISVITDLPPVADLGLDASVEDELTATWANTQNYGNYRVEYRESGSGSAYTLAGEPGQDDTDITITGLEDGEKYDVRLRGETEHVVTAWLELAEITKLPAPTALSVAGVTDTTVDLEWQDNADNEDGYRIERAPEKTNRRPTGYDAFEQAGSIGPDTDTAPSTTTYTDDTVKDNWDYKYRVVAYTEHVTAASGVVETTTDLTLPADEWLLELRRSDGELIGIPEADIKRQRVSPEVSAIGKWEVMIPASPYIKHWKRADAYLWHDATLLMRGELKTSRNRYGTGEMILEGPDHIARLKEGGAATQYQSTRVDAALRDYLETETAFEYTVTDQDPTQVDSGKVVQDESTDLSSIFNPTATTPLFVNADGELTVAQTCWTIEGENWDRQSGTTTAIADAYSATNAEEFTDTGQSVEYDFATAYDIPDGSFGFKFRAQKVTGNGTNHRLRVLLDGTEIGVFEWNGSLSVEWQDLQGFTDPGSVAAGSHTLRIESTQAQEDHIDIDVIAPYDTRYSYTFDNAVDGNNALSGPELYPPAVSTIGGAYEDSLNIAAATVTATIDDISGGQRLDASNDGGATYDGGSNTETTTVDFAAQGSVGTTIRGRPTLGRYGTQTTTPTSGYKGQTLSAWEIAIDTNTLSVIDDREFVGSHFENLQAIADAGDFVIVPDYQDDTPAVEAFVAGDVTRPAPWDDSDVLDHERAVTTEGYANQITVYGAVDESTGTRLAATAKSQSEIDEHGTVPAPPLFKPDLDSKADLKSLARTELGRRVAQDRITGSVEVPPTYVMPGYAYDVPTLARGNEDAPTLVLQSTEVRSGVDAATTTLDFEARGSLADALTSITTDVQSVKTTL